jgi:hypothetical protein
MLIVPDTALQCRKAHVVQADGFENVVDLKQSKIIKSSSYNIKETTMPTLEASISPIFVNEQAGETNGTTEISYRKAPYEELWWRFRSQQWIQINVMSHPGQNDEYSGKYDITLSPGEIYEVAVFEENRGPLSDLPSQVENSLEVFCLWQEPEKIAIFTEYQRTGGTWHERYLITQNPSIVMTVGVSLNQPGYKDNGMPYLPETVGGQTEPLAVSDDHLVKIMPLTPGNHYFFVAVLVDDSGRWGYLVDEFVTLRRKITVEFLTLHILNDGDPSGHGEGEFWFRVQTGAINQPDVIRLFHLPTQDIDDWNKKGRPYPVGFDHIEGFERVVPGQETISVASWGIEHDGAFEADEGAQNSGTPLPFPIGEHEAIINGLINVDCPTSTVGDDFHYSIDVRYSVEYAL